LKTFNFIKELIIWNVGLGDDGMQNVANLLIGNPLIETLEIIDNITRKGCCLKKVYNNYDRDFWGKFNIS
jgi:hypothetical protein